MTNMTNVCLFVVQVFVESLKINIINRVGCLVIFSNIFRTEKTFENENCFLIILLSCESSR